MNCLNHLSGRALAAIVVFLIAVAAGAPAFGVVTSTSGGTTTIVMTGDDSGNTLQMGSLLNLSHDRFTVGDPGYVSDHDFDSSLAGEQVVPHGPGSLTVALGAGVNVFNFGFGNGLEIDIHWDVSEGTNTLHFGSLRDNAAATVTGGPFAGGNSTLLDKRGLVGTSSFTADATAPWVITGEQRLGAAQGPDFATDLVLNLHTVQGTGSMEYNSGDFGRTRWTTNSTQLDGGLEALNGDLYLVGAPGVGVFDTTLLVGPDATVSGRQVQFLQRITVDGSLIAGGIDSPTDPLVTGGQLDAAAGVTFNAGSFLRQTIDGPPLPANFGQLVLSGGATDLSAATLALEIGPGIQAGEEYPIVVTSGTGTYSGTFVGMPQGTTIDSGSLRVRLDYRPTAVVAQVLAISPIEVPTLAHAGLAALAVLLGGAAVVAMRRGAVR